jgi:undecaprenyl-diphosphatase
MDLLHIIVLALIQGVTEFLPISSSAHLILPSELLGWQDQGLAFDVAVHVGTLAAVIIYFRHEVRALAEGWLQQFGPRGASDDSRLAWMVILGTVPAGLAGLLFNDYIEIYARSILVIAITTVVFGVLLGVADMRSSHQLRLVDMTWRLALAIGCAQALALIPGTSRSGITITAALLLGFNRPDSARFSFLLSIPVILLSGGYKGIELMIAQDDVEWGSIFLGALISGVSAYICIHYFLSFISRLSMMPFVVYRLILGGVLFLMVAYG